MTSNYYLNGSIGYTFLVNQNIKILILSDMHSELPYCEKNGVFISEWFKKKYKSKILLEEVPRSLATLKELWPSSIHTQKLKEVYLNNSNIIQGLDIRPELIPFSLELAFDKEAPSVNLKEYLNLMDLFFTLKLKFIQDNLNYIYTTNFLKTNNLGQHYINLKKKVKHFVKKYKNQLNKNIKDLIKNDDIFLNQTNDLTSEIMEWYSIAKIIQGINKNITSFILHAGLAHTTNIIKLLKLYYGYTIKEEFGITDMDHLNLNKVITGCLPLPSHIEKQFGGCKLLDFLTQ